MIICLIPETALWGRAIEARFRVKKKKINPHAQKLNDLYEIIAELGSYRLRA